MGTNYYIRKHLRPSKLKELKDLVNEESIYNGELNKALEDFKEIHIGKKSVGWRFCFDHNNWKYFNETRNSIKNFLEKEINEGGKLVDEYNVTINLKDFWDIVDNSKDGFIGESYYNYEKTRYEDYLKNPEKYKEEFFKPSKPISFPEIITEEGLRFCNSTDFC